MEWHLFYLCSWEDKGNTRVKTYRKTNNSVCAPGKDQFFFNSVLLCFHLISNFVIFLPVILPHFSPLLFSLVHSFSLYCSCCWQIWQEDRPQNKAVSTLAQPVMLCPRLCCRGFSSLFWLHWLLFVWPSFRDRTLIQLDRCVIVFPLCGDSLQSLSLILQSEKHHSNNCILWETRRPRQRSRGLSRLCDDYMMFKILWVIVLLPSWLMSLYRQLFYNLVSVTFSCLRFKRKKMLWTGWLWLRGRGSNLLSEGHWFDSPGLHFEVSLGKILNPKLLLMCWSASCVAATSINV